MPFDAIAPALLALAISFSWPRTVAIFRPSTAPLQARSIATMVATSISLSCLGLALSKNGPWLGSVVIVAGLCLAAAIRERQATLSVMLSAASLSAYLHVS